MSEYDPIKAARDRLLAEAQQQIDREAEADKAELDRLAAKYALRVITESDWQEFVRLRSSAPASSFTVNNSSNLTVDNGPNPNRQNMAVSGVKTLGQLIGLYRTDERSA